MRDGKGTSQGRLPEKYYVPRPVLDTGAWQEQDRWVDSYSPRDPYLSVSEACIGVFQEEGEKAFYKVVTA